jgi:acetylornithine deacetylase/succinyl-diaminopimelate desuccinylase-like protein
LVADLQEFVAFRTVSSQSAGRPHLLPAARWLAGRARAAGFPDVQVVEAGGAPAVVGRWNVDPAAPTLLLYGHYDVVPAETGQWEGSPFAVRRQGDRVYGRGVSDDKGFVLAQLTAVRRLATASRGRPPVNLRCLYEGEEEIGSPSLPNLLRAYRSRLAADAAVVCDTEGAVHDRVSITVSCRGGVTIAIEVAGPARDLHAGRFGGAVRQPAQALTEIIASLQDRTGRVRLPGFYERVVDITGALPDSGRLLAAAGVQTGWGESGFTSAEQVAIRPAVVVTQLSAGAPGPGPRHVLPAGASGQVNIRLVPDQDPVVVFRAMSRHVARHARSAGDLRARTRLLASGRPWQAQRQHPVIEVAAAGIRSVTGTGPAFVRSGGSIPALSMLEDHGVVNTSAVIGLAQPRDRAHGPEESIDLRRLALASEIIFEVLSRYGPVRPAREGRS